MMATMAMAVRASFRRPAPPRAAAMRPPARWGWTAPGASDRWVRQTRASASSRREAAAGRFLSSSSPAGALREVGDRRDSPAPGGSDGGGGAVPRGAPDKSYRARYRAQLRERCEVGDAIGAADLLRRMESLPLSPFDSDDYAWVLAALIEHGRGRDDWMALFGEIASDLASRACEVSPAAVARLHAATSASRSGLCDPPSTHCDNDAKPMPMAWEAVTQRDCSVQTDEVLAFRVSIDKVTWTCPVTGIHLRAHKPKAGGGPILKESMARQRQQLAILRELRKFSDWLRDVDGLPFTMLLEGGSNLKSLEARLEKADREREVPLMLLPQRARAKTLNSKKCDAKLLVSWIRTCGQLYVVPNEYFDDLFRIIVATTSRNNPKPTCTGPSSLEPCARRQGHDERDSLTVHRVLVSKDSFPDFGEGIGGASSTREWYRYPQPQLPEFAQQERRKMFEVLLEVAQRKSSEAVELKRFADWMRLGRPFTTVLDGANVQLENVESMVATLESKGEVPLVLIPEKLAQKQTALKNRLRSGGKLYVVPYLYDDDLFCMIATVSGSNKDPVILITNDLLRDYEQKSRDPHLFREWYANHCRGHAYGPSHIVGKLNVSNGGMELGVNKKNYLGRKIASLTSDQHQQMFDDIIELAQKTDNAADELKKFLDWMNERKGYPFTMFLDGANVGIDSIEAMVAKFDAKGEWPLVIMSEKTSRATVAAPLVTKRLKNRGKLYVVHDWHEDDLFLMIATLVDQAGSLNGHFNSCDNGIRPILITNDRLRDHKLKMRDPALFSEWYKHHCTKHCQLTGKIKLLPEILSRKIEWNEWPRNGQGNKTESKWDGKVFHFPVCSWGFLERFVLRLPIAS